MQGIVEDLHSHESRVDDLDAGSDFRASPITQPGEQHDTGPEPPEIGVPDQPQTDPTAGFAHAQPIGFGAISQPSLVENTVGIREPIDIEGIDDPVVNPGGDLELDG